MNACSPKYAPERNAPTPATSENGLHRSGPGAATVGGAPRPVAGRASGRNDRRCDKFATMAAQTTT